jgi:hypothetical protein
MASRVVSLAMQVAELNKSELSDFMVRIKAFGVTPEVSSSDSATEVFHALTNAILRSTGVRSMPLSVLKQQGRTWDKFLQASTGVEHLVSSLEKDRVKKLALRQWLCRLLISHMLENSIEPTWKNIAAVLPDLPVILDSAFPGYMSSGLMPKVLALLYKGIKPKFRNK